MGFFPLETYGGKKWE